MAHSDSWLQEYQQATELVDDAFIHLQERQDNLRQGADAARLTATVRRKISGLNSKIERLQALLADSNSVCVQQESLPNRRKPRPPDSVSLRDWTDLTLLLPLRLIAD